MEKEYPLLDQIQSPQDVKKLDLEQLRQLAGEIRSFLIHSIAKTGGHLSSNLGVVELTLAIHKVFQSPTDRIVFDVGHQSYTHKLLTGRKAGFVKLRKEGGLSGFPKQKESIHDAFLAGHSSTSISAAYGIARGLRMRGSDAFTIAVVGDGSFTGGMIYEAMNNAGRSNARLIVILNQNDMSISRNVGGLAKYLAVMRTKPGYRSLKNRAMHQLDHLPLVGKGIHKVISAEKTALKSRMLGCTIFEEMGFEYIGPVNGHNLQELIFALESAKSLARPVVIHVDTIKGKGYAPAESKPGEYHGVGGFDPDGDGLPARKEGFSSVMGRYLARLGESDLNLCAVTAAMKNGTGLNFFAEKFPIRFFDTAIAEEHAVTFCAGLATQGFLPVFAVYSTFLQRSYDQILHDCAIEPKHVVFMIDRAGFVGDDGETHQGLFDAAYLPTIPGLRIFSPESYGELRGCMDRALYEYTDGSVAVRYPRGEECCTHDLLGDGTQDYLLHRQGGKVLLVSYGRLCEEVMAAAKSLQADVLKLVCVRPVAQQAIQAAMDYDSIYFFEEGIKQGGIGMQFLDQMYESGYRGRIRVQAVDNQIAPQGSLASLYRRYGLDRESILSLVTRGGQEE